VEAAEGIVRIAARALQGEMSVEEGTQAGNEEKALAEDILNSLLLNLGGKLQAQGTTTQRMQDIILYGTQLYNEKCTRSREGEPSTRQVLCNSARYNLATVARAVMQVLTQEEAPDMLLEAVPEEAPRLTQEQVERLRELLRAFLASLARALAAMPPDTADSDALRNLQQVSRSLLSATAVLTVGSAEGGVDATLDLAAAWIKNFFVNAVGAGSEQVLNATRLRHFLEAGRNNMHETSLHTPCSVVVSTATQPHSALRDMGAVLVPEDLPEAVAAALLERLREAYTMQEEEIFKMRRIVTDNGKVSPGLEAVIKHGEDRMYIFIYDRSDLHQWSTQNGTIPDTREALNMHQSLPIS
jgi:hypothetical protein